MHNATVVFYALQTCKRSCRYVGGNLVREHGIWQKQSSAWFQALGATTTLEGNGRHMYAQFMTFEVLVLTSLVRSGVYPRCDAIGTLQYSSMAPAQPSTLMTPSVVVMW